MRDADLYFERDYKQDSTDSCLSMHCFLTPNFYIYLECGLDLIYRIDWAFNNCSYEDEVIKLLQLYPINLRSKQIALQPDHSTYYKRTLDYQGPRYVYCFKG